MAKKNCTCSLLLETIDKIFIDDSCCCQNTVVTPTDNCCNCEPVIDLIDTDKFACASFGKDRNLKYRIIREEWLTGGTNSKEVYETIIECQASGSMLLIKVIRNDVNENSKNYVLPPLEVSLDVESGVYFIKYLKFIGGNLHLCTYTIRLIDHDGVIFYETSWESKAIDDFDITQYYTKDEINNKFVTITYLTNNYYTGDTIDADFYRRSVLYRKDEIDDMFARKILWEKGNGSMSTQRIGAHCVANGDASFVTGYKNSGSGNGTSVTGNNNTVSGDYSSATGHDNIIEGKSNFTAGYSNRLESNYSMATGWNNTINGNYSEALGASNTIDGNFNFAGGQNNIISDSDTSTAFGYNNQISSNSSAAFGYQNKIIGTTDEKGNRHGSRSFAAGRNNTIEESNSMAVGSLNVVKGTSSAAIGVENIVKTNASYAIGNNNTARRHYSIALNHQSRSNGRASIAAGRRSYTDGTGAFAIGTPINVYYYATLVAPNALGPTENNPTPDPDYGYLVLTDIYGNRVNVDQNSIQAKRFTFIAENSYYGELSIDLTEAEKGNAQYTTRFPEFGTWPQLIDVKFVLGPSNNTYLYFKPSATEDVVWLFKNTIRDAGDNWADGVRNIGYASGFDGCKALNHGGNAEGYGTVASGMGSHSEGINTYTLNDGEHACGKYNYSDSTTLFSVGSGNQEYVNYHDGTDITIHRKNALEITNDNKIYLRFKDGNGNENLYDLGKMLDLLMSNVLSSAQIDSLKVTNRQEDIDNADGLVPLSLKEY